MSLAAALPLDVWVHVADLLQSPLLSWLCRRLRNALQGRHVRCAVGPKTAVPLLVELAERAALVRTLALTGLELGHYLPEPQFGALLCQVSAAPLEALYLGLSNTTLPGRPSFNLHRLGTMATLRRLTLVLSNNRLERADWAPALIQLPALEHLVIDLSNNFLDDGAAIALAGLVGCQHLLHLCLDLCSNAVADGGATALVHLAASPALEVLQLNLRRNKVRQHCKARLREIVPQHCTLTLHL
eukprot:EG_transcript_24282